MAAKPTGAPAAEPAATPTRDRPAEPVWTPTRAMRRGVGVAAVALLAAAALGRVELVLLAAPFALGTALSLAARPGRQPHARLTLDDPASIEGGPMDVRVSVRNDQALPMLCVINAQLPAWLRLRHGVGYYAAMLHPAGTAVVRLRGSVHRWGPYRVGPVTVWAAACDGLLRARRDVLPAVPLSVYPVSELFDSDEALPRAAGIAGIHRSRRLGEGGELAEVRPFQAGDRLRRIDWRVTLRTGEVYVTTTLSERDAEVVLLLDVRHEAGVSGGVDGAASVLDATVRAAAAITEHYAHQGDRVALVELGPRLRRLPAGTGRRHYLAALEWLVGIDLTPIPWLGDRLVSAALRPPHALVVVLTPLLDQDSANLLAMLARSGRTLVTLDTLPAGVHPRHESEWTAAGTRLWRLERANTIGRLREAGVPVERWRGAGSLDLMLRHVHRFAARAPGR